jgi:hypothetical protein
VGEKLGSLLSGHQDPAPNSDAASISFSNSTTTTIGVALKRDNLASTLVDQGVIQAIAPHVTVPL